jgi:hypothetical protein
MPKHQKKKEDNTPLLALGGMALVMLWMYNKKDDDVDFKQDPKVALAAKFARNFFKAFAVGTGGMTNEQYQAGLAVVQKGDFSWYKNAPELLKEQSVKEGLGIVLAKVQPAGKVTEQEFVKLMVSNFGK